MSRYPYTYACDVLRMTVTREYDRVALPMPILSRADASQLMLKVAEALGHDDSEQVARALADKFGVEVGMDDEVSA